MSEQPRYTRLASLLIFALLLFSASTSSADEYDRPGAYIGVNGVYGISLFQDDINAAFGIDDDFELGDSGGINARIGYRVASWFAIEAEYEWIKSMDLTILGQDLGDFKPNTVTANLKFFIPVWRMQPYLILGGGAAIWNIDSPIQNQSSTGFAGRVGLGLDNYLTKHWVVNLEATGVLNTNDIDPSKISSDITSISHIYYFSFSAGLTYRF